MITLELPLPPSKNRQYRRAKNGGVYLAPAVRTFREEVGLAKMVAHLRTIEDPCRLEAVFYPARNGIFDQANRMDQLLDALQQAGVVSNDRLFTDTHSRLGEVRPPSGGCVVKIYPLH